MKFLIKLTLITLFLTSSTIAEIVKIFEFTNEEFKKLKVRKVKAVSYTHLTLPTKA